MNERVGESVITTQGYVAEIIQYNNSKNVVVEFKDEYNAQITVSYGRFKYGTMRNPYHKGARGIGYIGVGDYSSSKNGTRTAQYNLWIGVFERCYNSTRHISRPRYEDCTVCEEWHNFQNFAKWYDENYYECNEETMCLDKDILIKGNKIYSPAACIFVTKKINSLFVKSNNIRGRFPIGVHQILDKYYTAYISVENRNVYCGCFHTPEEAFQAYKQAKEKYIKQIADEYRNIIPNKLYEALYSYEVEMDD